MELSYWEYKTWLSNIDYTIVGSGIVGLNCAIHLKELFPKAKVVVLEAGILPQGASTKNAGFACFGSISEVLSDLETHSEEEVYELVDQRWKGIQFLRQLLGDEAIGLQKLGGHELFLEKDHRLYDNCLGQLERINALLHPIFGARPFVKSNNKFQFNGIHPQYITHQFEGQLDTGQIMASLLKLAHKKGVMVLNNLKVESFQENPEKVLIKTNRLEFETARVLVATNGFASQLLDEEVRPARAQVVITAPIDNLHIKGTFHFNEGYYYFRNIDDRILFGGGRNLDFKAEETTAFGQSKHIQKELERLLRKIILPNTAFEIDRRWSGIMGVGNQKTPIVKPISDKIYCGIRLGGMGVALGTAIGRELAELAKASF